ncbi:DNA-directed RNA polymerase II subunit Rpb4p [Monosporozyma unispora]|nr:RNA polymerase B [Kazachstania unispora]
MNISTSTFQTSRRRLKKVEEEENATTLQLGHEFQLKQINHQGEEEELIALNLSETRLLIKEALIGRRRAFRKAQRSQTKKKANLNNSTTTSENGGETTAVEDEDEDDDEEDEEFMRNETREKELESLDSLLEQTTTGNNKDLKNTMEYLTNFSRFRDQETVGAVIQLLKSTGLHPFEIAQLGSLACDTADEAKTLIPSLNNKISDDELERILKELSNLETLY